MASFTLADDFQDFAPGSDPSGQTYTRTIAAAAVAGADVQGGGTFTPEALGDFGFSLGGLDALENVTVSIEGISLGTFLNENETDDRFDGVPGDAGAQNQAQTGVAALTEAEIEAILADGQVVITYAMGPEVDETSPPQEYLKATLAFDGTVPQLNAAPTAVADAVAVPEDAASGNLVAALLGNDTDPNAGDTLSIASVGTAGTLGSVAFDAAAQTLVYTADADAFDLLAPGATATDSFAYTVRDAAGLTSTATVAVTVTGGSNPATVSVGNGADQRDGTAGEDSISGGNGNDTLRGLDGADTLAGDNGDDRLDGGPGIDTLTGGRGNDVFVFAAGTGRDTVADFGQGNDVVAVDAALFADFAALRAAASQAGADVVIAAPTGDALVLQGVALASLGAGDFSFG